VESSQHFLGAVLRSHDFEVDRPSLRPGAHEERKLGGEILVAAGDNDRPRVPPLRLGAGCAQGCNELFRRSGVSQTHDFRHASLSHSGGACAPVDGLVPGFPGVKKRTRNDEGSAFALPSDPSSD
jgi:hypothetical protein